MCVKFAPESRFCNVKRWRDVQARRKILLIEAHFEKFKNTAGAVVPWSWGSPLPQLSPGKSDLNISAGRQSAPDGRGGGGRGVHFVCVCAESHGRRHLYTAHYSAPPRRPGRIYVCMVSVQVSERNETPSLCSDLNPDQSLFPGFSHNQL